MGIEVLLASSGLSDAARADVAGTMRTMRCGERYIDPVLVVPEPGASVTPVAMTAASVGGGDWFYNSVTGAGQSGVAGGTGLNNIGLLVRTSGKFTYVDAQTFLVYDGRVSLKCIVPTGVTLNSGWTWASVTGVSDCGDNSPTPTAVLQVRKQSDIQAF